MSWLHNLFINEAKPALDRHSGGSNNSGGEQMTFTNFAYFFIKGHRLEHLNDLDTSKGTSFTYMFNDCISLTSIPELDTRNGSDFSYMFGHCSSLTSIPELDVSKGTNFKYMFNNCSKLETVPVLDARNGVNFDGMFQSCSSLKTIQGLDTRKGTSFRQMFGYCQKLTSILEPFDTSNGTDFYYMFQNCSELKSIPELNTSKGTNFNGMFCNTNFLTEIPVLDTRRGVNFSEMLSRSGVSTVRGLYLDSATSMSSMFYSCSNLRNLYLYNIKANLTIGSGNSYGHNLKLDSLINTIRELRDTGASKTLTMGNTNLAKLADVYVRTIEITDEMRAEDEFIDEKLPFEVCESTDEGATPITEYVLFKNWEIK